MMDRYILVICIILFLLLDKFTTDGTEMCRRSIYRFQYNLRIVKSCPKSKDEWDRAAHDMKCNELAERGNCTNTVKQLRYHCVINSYMNETLEVCAPIRFIFGYCTEFNVAGRVIQSNYAARCNNVFPKCKPIYTSGNAYKYPDCYELVYKNRAFTTTALPQERNASYEWEHCDTNERQRVFFVYFCAILLISVFFIIQHALKHQIGFEICMWRNHLIQRYWSQ